MDDMAAWDCATSGRLCASRRRDDPSVDNHRWITLTSTTKPRAGRDDLVLNS
jgi:hypothetical protein